MLDNIDNIIQDDEYASNIPLNDGDSNSKDLDKYTLNTNIINDNKFIYTFDRYKRWKRLLFIRK